MFDRLRKIIYISKVKQMGKGKEKAGEKKKEVSKELYDELNTGP
ncbi:unnamed protein product, partial [marine sediment metagenome]